jgi:hypothetical protein
MTLLHSLRCTFAFGAPMDTTVLISARSCSLYCGSGGAVSSPSSSIDGVTNDLTERSMFAFAGTRSHHTACHVPCSHTFLIFVGFWLDHHPVELPLPVPDCTSARGENGVVSRTMTPAAKDCGLSSCVASSADWPRCALGCVWHSHSPCGRKGIMSRDSLHPAGAMQTKYASAAG